MEKESISNFLWRKNPFPSEQSIDLIPNNEDPTTPKCDCNEQERWNSNDFVYYTLFRGVLTESSS